jgi:hypothetical protein
MAYAALFIIQYNRIFTKRLGVDKERADTVIGVFARNATRRGALYKKSGVSCFVEIASSRFALLAMTCCEERN